jgi:uncharacterized protein YcfJ
MLGFGLAAQTLGAMEIFAGALGVASGVSSSYEVFSGNQIGDGTFTRVLGAAAAVTGGFYGNLTCVTQVEDTINVGVTES